MKASITKDSEYPVYGLRPWPTGIEIPDDLYLRYMANLAQYDAIQKELEAIYEAPDKAGAVCE